MQVWFLILSKLRGGAVVARQAHNLKVAGSSPAPVTKCACGEMVDACALGAHVSMAWGFESLQAHRLSVKRKVSVQ